jgi:type IV pilus assembly protein PilE
MKLQRGLTLIELMVVEAIIAILAAVVYPMYTDQTRKARRADAKIALEGVALAQERYYTLNGEYAVTLSSLGLDATSDQEYYDISITRSGADSEQFVATATAAASGQQASDTACNAFTVNQAGAQGAVDKGGNDNADYCW